MDSKTLIAAAIFTVVVFFAVSLVPKGSLISGVGNSANRIYAEPAAAQLAEAAGAGLRAGPRRGRVQGPLTAGGVLVADPTELTAAATAEAIGAGELSGEECFAAWADAAGGDELNAYLWLSQSDGVGAKHAPVAVYGGA